MFEDLKREKTAGGREGGYEEGFLRYRVDRARGNGPPDSFGKGFAMVSLMICISLGIHSSKTRNYFSRSWDFSFMTITTSQRSW